MAMLRYRVWYTIKGHRFPCFIIATGRNMDEVEADAKEILSDRGEYTIERWEKL